MFSMSHVQSGPHIQRAVGMLGLIPRNIVGECGGKGQLGFSFQADGREQGVFVLALLVDAQCKSVGVLLAEVRAGGAGALSRDPAEGAAATSLTEADRDLLSGGDLTWLLVHGPVLSVPGDMLVGCLDGRGCCSPEWGKSPVGTCGLVACLVGWVLIGDLSGTRAGAVDQTGHSVQGWVQHVGEGAGCLSVYWRAGADELHLSGGRRTVERRCPAVVPEVHLPVQGTGGLLEVPVLVGGDPHLDLSSLLHPAAWSTSVQGRVSWPG